MTSITEIGLDIAQIGHLVGPDHAIAPAAGAEERGDASLWALDRLLGPVAPRSVVVAPDVSNSSHRTEAP